MNPLVEPPAESFVEMMTETLKAGVDRLPGIGSDIKKAAVSEGAYAETPIESLLSLFGAVGELSKRLAGINSPLLLLSSRDDHIVPTSNGDLLADQYGGSVERVLLEESFHVATLDNDAPEIEERSVAFALKVSAS